MHYSTCGRLKFIASNLLAGNVSKEAHILLHVPNMESAASQMLTDIVIDCNDVSNQPQRKISNLSQNSKTRIQASIQQIKQNQRNIIIFLIFLIVSSDLLTRLLKSSSALPVEE